MTSREKKFYKKEIIGIKSDLSKVAVELEEVGTKKQIISKKMFNLGKTYGFLCEIIMRLNELEGKIE